MSSAIVFNVYGDTEGGGPWQCDFHYFPTTDTVDVWNTIYDLLQDFGTRLQDVSLGMATVLPNKCTVRGIKGRPMFDGSGYLPYQSDLSSFTGSRGSGEVLPEGVGPLVMLYSNPTGTPPFRGRLYLPAILESDQDAGAISSDLVNDIDAFIDNLGDLTGPDGATAWLAITSVTLNASREIITNATMDKLARIKRRGRWFQGRS